MIVVNWGAGLEPVAQFICNSANYIVTFAMLALKEVRIPLANNLVKRSREISKRVKQSRYIDQSWV
jgi:hypothetical protein